MNKIICYNSKTSPGLFLSQIGTKPLLSAYIREVDNACGRVGVEVTVRGRSFGRRRGSRYRAYLIHIGSGLTDKLQLYPDEFRSAGLIVKAAEVLAAKAVLMGFPL